MLISDKRLEMQHHSHVSVSVCLSIFLSICQCSSFGICFLGMRGHKQKQMGVINHGLHGKVMYSKKKIRMINDMNTILTEGGYQLYSSLFCRCDASVSVLVNLYAYICLASCLSNWLVIGPHICLFDWPAVLLSYCLRFWKK